MIWASLVASNVGAITITANNSNTKVYPSSFSNESNHTRQSATDMTMMKMMERGDIAMGFNQNKITHHFVATPDGGKIMITALNGSDKRTIDEIKNHTLDIQKEFSEGNFTKPFFIHAQEVPGTKVMSEKKDLIKYNIRNLNNGSSLQLTTNDKELIDSITQFMEFQAREHYGH
jgi:DNA-binding transcriptional regulator GbsR (MarR family)